MTVLMSAKSVLIRPGVVIRSVMPWTPLQQDLVGHLEGVEHRRVLVGDRQQAVVGDDDLGVDRLLQALDALLGLHRAAPALEAERAGDHGDRQGPDAPGDLGDDRGGAGAGAAALARGDEHHVGPGDGLLDLGSVGLSRLAADIGIAAGAEATGQVPSDVELHLGVAHQQRLGVGVDGDEVDALQAGVDHAVDGIDTAAADAHDLDHGQVVLGIADHGVLHLGAPAPAAASGITFR